MKFTLTLSLDRNNLNQMGYTRLYLNTSDVNENFWELCKVNTQHRVPAEHYDLNRLNDSNTRSNFVVAIIIIFLSTMGPGILLCTDFSQINDYAPVSTTNPQCNVQYNDLLLNQAI